MDVELVNKHCKRFLRKTHHFQKYFTNECQG